MSQTISDNTAAILFQKLAINYTLSEDEMKLLTSNIEQPIMSASIERCLKGTQIGGVISDDNFTVISKIFNFLLSNEEDHGLRKSNERNSCVNSSG